MFKGNKSYKDTTTKSSSRKKVELTDSKKADISSWARAYNKEELIKDLVLFFLVIVGICLVVKFYL